MNIEFNYLSNLNILVMKFEILFNDNDSISLNDKTFNSVYEISKIDGYSFDERLKCLLLKSVIRDFKDFKETKKMYDNYKYYIDGESSSVAKSK